MSEFNVLAEVTGSLWKLEVAEGHQVETGDTLCILESMKMEIPVEAPVSGTVLRVLVDEGDAVVDEQLLLVLSVK